MSQKNLATSGIALFLLFLIFSILVRYGVFSYLDLKVLLFIQKNLPGIVITLFSVLSIVGTLEVVSLFLLPVLFFISKRGKFYVLFGYGILLATEFFGKYFIPQKGPPLQFLKTEFFFNLPLTQIAQNYFAYPSGHAGRTSFISLVILYFVVSSRRFSKGQKYLIIAGILAFDGLMFFSRIYLAEHWTSDVIGGIMLGLSLALISLSMVKSMWRK